MPGAVACDQWGHPVGVLVAGRVMGPGVGAQRHPQMDVRDAAGLGTSSMLGSALWAQQGCQWNGLEGQE